MRRAALAAGLAFALAPAAAQSPTIPLRMLNGMEAVRYDANRIAVYRGSAADNTGRHLIQFPATILADIGVVGANGRDDVATPEDLRERAAEMQADAVAPGGHRPVYRDGHALAGRPLSGWYMPVYAADAGGEAAVVLTRQQSSQRTDRDGDARLPGRFIARRNAPVAFFHDPERGFRPMICHGWPQPFCLWTRIPPFEAGPVLLAGGRASAPAQIDAREAVPGIGRILRMQIVLRGERNGGGARLFTTARGEGLLVAHVARQGDVAVAFVDLALTSARQFHYAVDDGVSLDIAAIGFSILQPN